MQNPSMEMTDWLNMKRNLPHGRFKYFEELETQNVRLSIDKIPRKNKQRHHQFENKHHYPRHLKSIIRDTSSGAGLKI